MRTLSSAERVAAGRASTSRSQRLGPHQRHVAVQHEHEVIVGDRRHGLLHRVTGAELFGLQRPSASAFAGQRLAHLLAAVAVDDVDVAARRARARCR